MNQTKAKGLIKKLRAIDKLILEVKNELNFGNILGLALDYTSITRKDLEKRFNIT